MLRAVRLLLPALFPSWRFFALVAPSPRLEMATLATPNAPPHWRPFSPKPERITGLARLARLAWSPAQNEALYLVTCAERVLANNDDQSHDPYAEREILARVGAHLRGQAAPPDPAHWYCVRLLVVQREGADLARREAWRSGPHPLGDAEPRS